MVLLLLHAYQTSTNRPKSANKYLDSLISLPKFLPSCSASELTPPVLRRSAFCENSVLRIFCAVLRKTLISALISAFSSEKTRRVLRPVLSIAVLLYVMSCPVSPQYLIAAILNTVKRYTFIRYGQKYVNHFNNTIHVLYHLLRILNVFSRLSGSTALSSMYWSA